MTTATSTQQTVTVLHTNQNVIRCVARVDMPEYGIQAGQVFFLRKVSKGVYEIRTLETLNRREISNGSVVYTVKNGDGKTYHPFLNRSKLHTCDCDAGQHGRKCYHVEYARYRENARFVAARAKVTPITSLEGKGNLGPNKSFSLLKQAS